MSSPNYEGVTSSSDECYESEIMCKIDKIVHR